MIKIGKDFECPLQRLPAGVHPMNLVPLGNQDGFHGAGGPFLIVGDQDASARASGWTAGSVIRHCRDRENSRVVPEIW